MQFVEFDEIDPVLFKKSYYLIPEETGAKAYALLREAMKEDERVGIAKVSFRDKEHLAALRFKDDAFVLETMYWPDEIREADFGGVDVHEEVRDQELGMARQLIDSLTGAWDPSEYADAYREALTADRRGEAQRPGDRGRRGRARRQGRRPDGGAEGKRRAAAKTEPEKAAPKRKSAAKKPAAKKPAARKKAVGE